MWTGLSHRFSAAARTAAAAVAALSIVIGVAVPDRATAAPAPAPPPSGTIAGVVVDRGTGRPLAFANVMIVRTAFGALSNAQGEFRIANLPAGKYEIRATHVGHDDSPQQHVAVGPGATATLRLALVERAGKLLPPVVVRSEVRVWSVTESNVAHGRAADKIADIPAETIAEVVATEAGVVSDNGELHVQGAFGRQLLTVTDGVSSTDPLTGNTLDLSTLSVADYELISGGLDAEYGNATSVLQYSTRAGGRRFSGTLNYRTDDYGRADKTFTNFDQLAFSFGGPSPFEGLTYFVAAEASGEDGEHPAPRTAGERRWLDGLVQWKERGNTQLRGQARLDWKSRAFQTSAEFTLDGGRQDAYVHTWTVPGATRRLVSFLEARPNPRDSGRWILSGNRFTTADGPWRAQAATARFADIRDEPACTYCLVPVSDDVTLRTARITEPSSNGTPGRMAFVLVDQPLFVGYQRPQSTWSPDSTGVPGDSSLVAYNPSDHLPSTRSQSHQAKWAFTHTLSNKTFYDVHVSRLVFDVTTDVDGKTPAEYSTAGKLVWVPGRGPQTIGNADFYTDRDVPFLVTAYDFPLWDHRRTDTWMLRSDVSTLHWAGHKVKGGLQLQYADLEAAGITSPGQQRTFRAAAGLSRNTFHVDAPEGSIYVQDRWSHEGMVVNAGLRYDFFSPGSGVGVEVRNRDIQRTLDRWQTQWSPRLGLAFPITDRDVFHFHYGRFIQFAPKQYLYASQDPTWGGTLGNPNLQPETSVAFQAGIKHQWSRDVSMQFALFNKDLYGLVSSVDVTDDSTGLQRLRFINRSYASTRGVEVSIAKALSRGFALDVAYTWAFADGVSSSADFGRQAQGLSHLPTGERPLDWDQRHTFNTVLTLARGGDWSATTVFQYGSGLPWTPVRRFVKRQDPALENSLRRPSTHTVNFRGQKFFHMYGRDLRLFFDGKNLLNEAQPVVLDATFGPAPPEATPAYLEYATETGRFGGAYLHDGDGDGRDEYYPVNDPAVFAPRRQFRVGVGLEF